MKIQTLPLLAAAALLAGCAGSHQNTNMGASSDIDQNVLTGGPISGTMLDELPQPVKRTVRHYDPNAEISDINKLKRDSTVVYRINFIDPLHHPALYVMADGGVWWESSVDR